MLSFNDYNNILEYLEDEIKCVEREITYREIELIGHKRECCSYGTTINSTSIFSGVNENFDEKKIFESDMVYQRLLYHLKDLRNRLDFISTHGDYPSEKINEENIFD